MGVVQTLKDLAGDWTGVNAMRFMPTDEYTESPSTARVTITAGSFVTITYTWSNDDGTQDGQLLIGDGSAPQEATGIWVDSFHQTPKWMALQGVTTTQGVALEGTYSASEGPDWGWRIHIGAYDLTITMANIPPGTEAYEVVRATYQRAR